MDDKRQNKTEPRNRDAQPACNCCCRLETVPEAVAKEMPRPKKPKGIFGRFLDRLAKANEREFGSDGPSCCG